MEGTGNTAPDSVTMEKIVSLCKRRGFVYQGSEIYGGLAGTWDYGPLGVALKNNIKNIWWRMFVECRDDMYGVDAAILMNAKVWEASGHVGGFADPMVECQKCGLSFRADEIDEDTFRFSPEEEENSEFVGSMIWECPRCKKENINNGPHPNGTGRDSIVSRPFNLMFETRIGAGVSAIKTYFRPETAGGMFVNFKNVMDSFHPKLPFGLAQIGKAFRNEIAPRDFIFRAREFEQMEIEYFVRENDWERAFEEWREEVHRFNEAVGIPKESVHELEVSEEDRAHYSKRTIDFEFDFPFGRKELYGLAYRTDFDLSAHAEASGANLNYLDEETKQTFRPHVIEPSFGVDRTVLAVLASAYTEDELGGEKRIYLKLKPAVAPIRAAVFPLLKNKPELIEKARSLRDILRTTIPNIAWDDNGNIGKRYRRQDEIGTPVCITVDFQTLEDDTVTLRDRDTGEQRRVACADVCAALDVVSL